MGGSENHAASTPSIPQTILQHLAGYSQNHCGASLLDDIGASIGVVCGSDNHMFVTIHNPDGMTRSILSTFESEGSQSDECDLSNQRIRIDRA
jgi:hypothetical protein